MWEPAQAKLQQIRRTTRTSSDHDHEIADTCAQMQKCDAPTRLTARKKTHQIHRNFIENVIAVLVGKTVRFICNLQHFVKLIGFFIAPNFIEISSRPARRERAKMVNVRGLVVFSNFFFLQALLFATRLRTARTTMILHTSCMHPVLVASTP